MKLQLILEEILREEESKKQIAAMDQAMGDAFKTLGAELEANKEEIQQDVANADVNEEKLHEVIDPITIIGIALAAPKVIELFAKAIGRLVAAWKRLVKPGQAKGSEEEFASTIIEFTHKWHKLYIKGIKWILSVSGVFKKAGVKDEATKEKAAEVMYYVIVAGLAVYAGVGAVKAFKSALQGGASAVGDFSLGGLETAMVAVKSTEVKEFLMKMGLSTTAGA